MVCSKCLKLTKSTKLATPEVKKKSEMYYGSPATAKAGSSKSVTLGNTGVSKVNEDCFPLHSRDRLLTGPQE